MENMEKIAYAQTFVEMLGSPEGKAEIGTAGSNFIQTVLREDGLARRIIPFKKADVSKLQRRTNTDELYDLVDIAPNSGAVIANFTAAAPTKYVNTKRAELTFSEVKAVTVEKTVEELLAIPYDIFGFIREYSIKDMQELEDRTYLSALDACTAAVTADVDNRVAKIIKDTTPNAVLTKEHFRALKNTMETDRLRGTRIVCADADLNDLILWNASEAGFEFAQNVITKPGALAQYAKNLFGLDVISSIKTELFRETYSLTGIAATPEKVTLTASATVTVANDIDSVEGVFTSQYFYPETKLVASSFTGKAITLSAPLTGDVYVKYNKKTAIETRVKKKFYIITDNNFLGAARELQPIQFWSEKIENKVRMGAFESIGMVIANARAVGKLELG